MILSKLLREAAAKVARMTPEEKETMYKQQRESFVRGQIGWPKSKYKMINGVKVYDSYEDYVND